MTVIAVIVLVVTAQPAGAHVTVDPGEAIQGRFAYLDVRVPNEANELSEVQDGARTNRVEFTIPTDDPITVVQVQSTPGWDYELETTPLDEPIEQDAGEPITEVVSKVTWTGGDVGPPEFAVFHIVMGPLPEDADMLMFPTVQAYDSGEEVVWDEVDHDGEFPAPSLTLVPPGEEGATGEMGPTAGGQSGGLAVEGTATRDDVDGANIRGIIGIIIGLAGVALAVLALLRSRGGAPPAVPDPRSRPAAATSRPEDSSEAAEASSARADTTSTPLETS